MSLLPHPAKGLCGWAHPAREQLYQTTTMLYFPDTTSLLCTASLQPGKGYDSKDCFICGPPPICEVKHSSPCVTLVGAGSVKDLVW